MPRAGSKSPKPAKSPKVVTQGTYWLPNDAEWFGFVNVSLDDDQKVAFELWYAENEAEINHYLEDIVGEGMKYGYAYDRENECGIVSFTGCLWAGSNLRACVTSRAATWADANALAVFKHVVLVNCDYGDLMANGRKRSWG